MLNLSTAKEAKKPYLSDSTLFSDIIVPGETSCYYQGLLRVAKPIDTNPNYSDFISSKVKSFLEQLRVKAGLNECIKSDVKSLFPKGLHGFRPVRYALDNHSWIAYGRTRNNLREFSFLQELLKRNNINVGLDNLGLKSPVRIPNAIDMNSYFISSIIKSFYQYCDQRDSLSAALFYQLIQYTKSYISWESTLPVDASESISLAVVANDHSQTSVAFSMKFKELGIARLYVQHAEVSNSFPSLDFEISVLRNQASLDIYSGIGPVPGKVFILPREKDRFDLAKLRRMRETSVTLGVYLTSQINFEELERAVALLLKNSSVGKIFIKPHPSTPLERLRQVLPKGVLIESEIPAYDHIAVVCNSSVVVELLHRGIPVFQTFSMDPVPDDYYGFVREGIALHVPFQELSGEFWHNYSDHITERWLEAFARLDPTVNITHEDSERKFIGEIRKYIKQKNERPFNGNSKGFSFIRLRQNLISVMRGGNRREHDFDSRFLRHMLQLAPYTILNVPRALMIGLEATDRERRIWNQDELIISQLEALFNERNSILPAIFEVARSVEMKSAAVSWARLKGAQWVRRDIGRDELNEIFSFVMHYCGPKKVKGKLETLLFSYLVRVNDIDGIADFFRQSKILRVDSLPVNRRIELLKIIKNNQRKDALFENLADHLFLGLSDFNQLKLKVLSHSQENDFHQFDHQMLEKQFLLCAPQSIAKEFCDFVKVHYDALRSRLSFMDVRFKQGQRELFYQKVGQALKHKIPFSLVRLGDGEGYIFEGQRRFFNEDDARNRERHWWGQEIPAEPRAEYLPRIRDAVSNADVLGIPSVYRFLRDHTDRSVSLAQSLQGRGLLEVMNGVREIAGPDTLFSEDRCNFPLFGALDACYQLLEEAFRVVVISSANELELRQTLSFVGSLVVISIPTHFSRHENGKYIVGGMPLPYTYQTVIKLIRETVQPGDLVLVAGGVIGKIFIQEAKNRGAVSLDIGGALDEWIGAGVGFHY